MVQFGNIMSSGLELASCGSGISQLSWFSLRRIEIGFNFMTGDEDTDWFNGLFSVMKLVF